jgi:rare lipoprotein A
MREKIIKRQFILRHITPVLIMLVYIGVPPALSANEAQQDQIDVVSDTKPVRGMASFYDEKFNGRLTASGEIFNNSDLTAAHLSLPFGSHVKVTNIRNGRSVVVRINDRGPYAKGRIIDLSKAAAKTIGISRSGVARVKLEVLQK